MSGAKSRFTTEQHQQAYAKLLSMLDSGEPPQIMTSNGRTGLRLSGDGNPPIRMSKAGYLQAKEDRSASWCPVKDSTISRLIGASVPERDLQQETENEKMITRSRLQTEYGLTRKQIDLLGAPDKEVPNPHFPKAAAPMKLYRRARVESWIKHPSE